VAEGSSDSEGEGGGGALLGLAYASDEEAEDAGSEEEGKGDGGKAAAQEDTGAGAGAGDQVGMPGGAAQAAVSYAKGDRCVAVGRRRAARRPCAAHERGGCAQRSGIAGMAEQPRKLGLTHWGAAS
jgi:hypothetical protein